MGRRAPAPEDQTTSAADDLAVRLARLHKLADQLAFVQRQTRQRVAMPHGFASMPMPRAKRSARTIPNRTASARSKRP